MATENIQRGKWILDSGCTFHMCPYKNYFLDYQEIDGGKVMMGNNAVCRIIGMGNVNLKLHNGKIQELKEVRHVPDLKRNLISLGMVDQSGFSIKIESGKLMITNGTRIVMEGTKRNEVYVLDGEAITGLFNVSIGFEKDKTKLWHLRLGHMSVKGLMELQKQGVLGDKKIKELDFCEDCVLGKTTRSSFKSSTHTTCGILDYIHSDLWGPSSNSFTRW